MFEFLFPCIVLSVDAASLLCSCAVWQHALYLDAPCYGQRRTTVIRSKPDSSQIEEETTFEFLPACRQVRAIFSAVFLSFLQGFLKCISLAVGPSKLCKRLSLPNPLIVEAVLASCRPPQYRYSLECVPESQTLPLQYSFKLDRQAGNVRWHWRQATKF